MYVCMYVMCIYVCMYVCSMLYVNVCTFICMYVFIKLHITTQSGPVNHSMPLALILPRGMYVCIY